MTTPHFRHATVVAMTMVATAMLASRAVAQGAAAPPDSATVSTRPTLPPATKLEAFKPTAGSVLLMGYTNVKSPGSVNIDARELRDVKGGVTVRGLVVQVTESAYRRERAFVDVDEVPELLKGIDALLEIQQNPTAFERFQASCTTKGGLELTAYSDYVGISYSVETGRVLVARRDYNQKDFQKFRAALAAAYEKLTTTVAAPR
jgi:hypothetical protein